MGGLWQPAWSKPPGIIFPAALAHFKSLGHISVIFPIFQVLSLLLQLLWWSAISYLWCYYCVIVWGHHKPHPLRWELNQWTLCLFRLLQEPATPQLLSPCPWASLFPWDTIFKLSQWISLHLTASKCLTESKSCRSPTLNQKLEMIKLNKKDMSQGKRGQMLGLLHWLAKLWR